MGFKKSGNWRKKAGNSQKKPPYGVASKHACFIGQGCKKDKVQKGG